MPVNITILDPNPTEDQVIDTPVITVSGTHDYVHVSDVSEETIVGWLDREIADRWRQKRTDYFVEKMPDASKLMEDWMWRNHEDLAKRWESERDEWQSGQASGISEIESMEEWLGNTNSETAEAWEKENWIAQNTPTKLEILEMWMQENYYSVYEMWQQEKQRLLIENKPHFLNSPKQKGGGGLSIHVRVKYVGEEEEGTEFPVVYPSIQKDSWSKGACPKKRN